MNQHSDDRTEPIRVIPAATHGERWTPPRGASRVATHRRTGGGRTGRRVIAVLVTLVVVVGAGWFALGAMSCMSPPHVGIVAAPDVAPFLERAAADARAGGTCAVYTVVGRSDPLAAESLALSDGSAPPQVWVPGSSMLLSRAAALGAGGIPEAGISIGSSPLVLALAPDAATRLGWPEQRPTWYDVLRDDAIAMGVPDPARDPLGMASLQEIRAATTADADPAAAFTAALRRVSAHTTVDVQDLYDLLPGTAGVESPVSAFPTSELALLRHNVRRPDLALTAVYPQTTRAALDFPFTVLGTADDAQRAAADSLLTALLAPEGQAVLADGGFRTPGGAMLREGAGDRRTFPSTLGFSPLTETPGTTEVLSRWATVNRSARVQVLLDVSGSMNAPVPGLDVTRMAALIQAAEGGLRLFQPTTRLGYWTFSTNLDGDRDYREVIPVMPVRDLLAGDQLQVLRSIQATPDGGTGLYDSVLAAYRDAQANWEPGRLNLVIIMTDGNNQDSVSITREQLLQELTSTADPNRPVVLVGVTIGPDVDPAELEEITAATGGPTNVAADPARIAEVFFAGLSALNG